MSEESPSNIERVKFRTTLGIKVKVKEFEYQKLMEEAIECNSGGYMQNVVIEKDLSKESFTYWQKLVRIWVIINTLINIGY